MSCENPNCHCRGEVTVAPGGCLVCSQNCRPDSARLGEPCNCGHLGCELVTGFILVQPEVAFA